MSGDPLFVVPDDHPDDHHQDHVHRAIIDPHDVQVFDQDGDGVIGDAEHDRHYWRPQSTAFTCAIQAQRGIIHEFTGYPVSEAELTHYATLDGDLDADRGMCAEEVGDLLERYGVGCHKVIDAEVSDLVGELGHGHKVIVTIDGTAVFDPSHPLADFNVQAANHAVWVTGIDTSDPAHPKVIINDSGDPDGAGKAYDLRRFVEAWKSSGYSYVATDEAPTDISEITDDFDTSSGTFTKLFDYVKVWLPTLAISGIAYVAGSAATAATGSDTAGSVVQIATQSGLDAIVDRLTPKLPAPGVAALNEAERDQLLREI